MFSGEKLGNAAAHPSGQIAFFNRDDFARLRGGL
jgi:hypothetical protein